MPKNLNKEEIDDVPVVDDALLDIAAELVELPVVLAAPAAAAGPVPGKRALGVKEPIIFKWKLIGTSHNATLTLFKSVEREDMDAQFERTQREGYYTDLKILDADAKVEQPVQPKVTKKASPRIERGAKAAAASTATRTEVAKRSSPPPASPPRKPTPAQSALKTEVKTRKKKPSGSAGASKRAAKKK
jgi:hypothetical protein